MLGMRHQVSRMIEFRMSKRPIWYHDFADLGFPTRVIDSSYAQAQALKVGPFARQFSRAMAGRADSELSSIQGLELFCADAYFSQYAILNGIGRMVGIDLDIESPEKRGGVLLQAEAASAALGTADRFAAVRGDVLKFDGHFDFCINYGGLYHLLDPASLLRRCRERIRGPMLLQTVVSLSDTSDEYFESPAPGWTWGCRFSEGYLRSMLDESGWEVEAWESGVAEYNRGMSDRGVVFALCRPK